MADVFEEVEEQLRSDRYQSLFKKAWPIALGLAVLALLVYAGVWGWRAYSDRQMAQASQTYAQALEALARNDKAAAGRQFDQLARNAPKGYRTLALMNQAALRTEEGKTAEAVALLDRAAETSSEPLMADAARLKAVYLLFDTAPLADIEKRLTPLTEAGRPYAALAREALAMKRLTAGRTAEARSAFSALSLLPDATDDLRARAQAAVALIDSGLASQIPAIVAAAAALPPAQAVAPAAVGRAAAPPQSQPQAPAPGAASPAGAPQ